LAEKFGATFSHNYLNGYFETAQSDEIGIEFCDYSQSLGEMYQNFFISLDLASALLNGRGASAGVAKGKVKIIKSPTDEIKADEVLVCDRTSPELVGQMQKATAIVTNQGGILSHAAIVARELGKPCVVGTGNATKILRNGQAITVDGTKGTVVLG
jgi:phosphoenolpyruvate synthase/pyruvate phosphate dikinase